MKHVVMTLTEKRRWFAGLLLGLTGLATGCGAPGDETEAAPTSDAEPLYAKADKIWPMHQIPVCWNFTGYDTEKQWVRDTLKGQRSWETAGDVTFEQWTDCVHPFTGIQLEHTDFLVHPTATTIYKDQNDGGDIIYLDFKSAPETKYAACVANGLNREQCIKEVALHEFGHALGFAHEQARLATFYADPVCYGTKQQGGPGDEEFPLDADLESILSYCRNNYQLSQYDRLGLRRWYGAPYWDQAKLRDYDADQRADFLCHDTSTGKHWIDYANTSAQLNGTDWSHDGGWCATSSQHLIRGDFTGDGRTDLLCHDRNYGKLWIDYADTLAHFDGTDWSRAAQWCALDSAEIFVGRFNDDLRDDILCHDRDSGKLWIDYADTAGTFMGTDWSHAHNFCAGDTRNQLFIADFNGDQKEDLLCFFQGLGVDSVDYADATGRFMGPDWVRSNESTPFWCEGQSEEMFVGKFNNDTRFDLLCHDTVTGKIKVDLAASTEPRFGTVDWTSADTDGWCYQSTGRIFVGDLNKDSRSDLLCYDIETGQRWASYADSAGHFNGTSWSSGGDGWCTHDSGQVH
ncbi:MAG TPA: hypothetical protein VNN72_16610 [Polyangiaceae bacterium]|nr:hypothetical protein [Polyangiaceae bacterium]